MLLQLLKRYLYYLLPLQLEAPLQPDSPLQPEAPLQPDLPLQPFCAEDASSLLEVSPLQAAKPPTATKPAIAAVAILREIIFFSINVPLLLCYVTLPNVPSSKESLCFSIRTVERNVTLLKDIFLIKHELLPNVALAPHFNRQSIIKDTTSNNVYALRTAQYMSQHN